MAEKEYQKDFGAPFDDADADIILRSADQVDFWVYRIILAKASPIFADMFSLPQQTNCDSDARLAVPVIPVAEDTTTLANLLTMCYPFEDPSLTVLEEVALVLAASRKYELAHARAAARRLFYSSPEFAAQPIKAFRLAWTYRLAPETREAAKKTLEGPMTLASLGQELRYMEGEAAYQLSDYRTRCEGVLKKFWTEKNGVGIRFIPLITSEEMSQCFPSISSCSECRYRVATSSMAASCHESLVPYMWAALEALRSRLAGTSITAEETAAITLLAREEHSSYCTTQAHAATTKGLAKFSKLLASKVDDYISSVSQVRILA
jgi:BTB/POZ domain